MIAMGAPGSADKDAITEIAELLSDPKAYQAKISDLLQKTLDSKQAAKDAAKARAEAESSIAQIAKDTDALNKARAAYDDKMSAQKADMAAREAEVTKREQNCLARESALPEREAMLAAAIAQAKASADAERDAIAKKNADVDQRKAKLDADIIAWQKSCDKREKDISDLEASTTQLNNEALSLKADYEQKLAALLSIAGVKK